MNTSGHNALRMRRISEVPLRREGQGCLKSAERARVTGETAQNRIAQPEDRPTRYTPSIIIIIIDTALHSHFVAKILLTHKILLHILPLLKSNTLSKKYPIKMR